MNALEVLSSQPWVERLGWTLIHFIWQGGAIAVLYGVVRSTLTRRSSASSRYLLACFALAAMMTAPLVTWSLIRRPDAMPARVLRASGTLAPVPTAIIALPAPVRTSVAASRSGRLLPSIVAIWLIGAAAFWVRLAGGLVAATRLRSQRVRPAPAEWQQILDRLRGRIGVSRPVRLLVSAIVRAPAVVGWIRPVVLVPVGAIGGLPAGYLEALLVHELAHIRRHDYLVNIVQSIAEALLFYHPAVWWVSGHIRAERELCCDDMAVAASGDVLTYAQALLELESPGPARFQTALAAGGGGSLVERIARLLGQPLPASRAGIGPALLTSAILLAAAAYGLFAQSAARPEFQVASVKPNTTETRRMMAIRPQPGGRLTTHNAPLRLLIQNAYSVQAYQIAGGPAWINSEGYDIEAKPASATERDQMWLMVQSLLAERFKLALHRETRELPAYSLTAARGGTKLGTPKEGGCTPVQPGAPPSQGSPPCGHVVISMASTGLSFDGVRVPMAEVTRMLATLMGRPVVDDTGVSGEFDIHITGFTPDQSTMGLPGSGGVGDPGGPRLPEDATRPTVFAALQEQAGLRLVSSKAPVEVLVIDHAERPAAN
jgi:uncharacterized protein (TIGR03435 family)